MNSVCNKLLKPIDGSCCQTLPPPNLLQKLSACFFLGSALVLLLLHLLGGGHHRRPVPPDVESLEEKKPATAAAPPGPKAPFQALCRMGVIMAYFYLCDRADVFMKEQKFYSHSTFFIPLIYIFILGVFYSENSKEVRARALHRACKGAFSGNNGKDPLCFPQTKLLNREQTDEWKGWMQLVILIYHVSGASVVSPPRTPTSAEPVREGGEGFIVPVCSSVYSRVHARAGAGGGVPLPDRLRTLLLLLAEGRLQSVPSVSGEPPPQEPPRCRCPRFTRVVSTPGPVPAQLPGPGPVRGHGPALPVLLLCAISDLLVLHHLWNFGLVASDPAEEGHQ